MRKVKNIFSSCMSTVYAVLIVFVLWTVKLAKVASDFAPFFFAWSLPIIIFSVALGKWLFWTYFTIWILFLGTRAGLEAAEELH